MKAIDSGVQLNSANDDKIREDFIAYMVSVFGYHAAVAESMLITMQDSGFVVSRCAPKPNN